MPIPTLLNLRADTKLPDGKCVMITSGDTTDFDGYYCAAWDEEMREKTTDLVTVNVVARRRATPDRTAERNVHDDKFSDECMKVGGVLMRYISPETRFFEGPLNEENFIPNKFIAHEKEKYKKALKRLYNIAPTDLNGDEKLKQAFDNDSFEVS